MHGIAGLIVFLSAVVVICLVVGLNHVHHNPHDWRGPTDRS